MCVFGTSLEASCVIVIIFLEWEVRVMQMLFGNPLFFHRFYYSILCRRRTASVINRVPEVKFSLRDLGRHRDRDRERDRDRDRERERERDRYRDREIER